MNVLEKNQEKNIKNIKKMIEYKNNFILLSSQFKNRKQKMFKQLDKLKYLLDVCNKIESRLQHKILNIEEKFSNKNNLTDDMRKNNIIFNSKKQLHNIRDSKIEIIKALFTVNSNIENLFLRIDQLCFDNIVMFSTIMRNFDELTKI